MAFWWVNQNQTYEHEINGGYLWSPKQNSNGARNQFYENMKLVQPGDVLFSFRKQHIADVGVVQQTARSVPKPEEFGQAGDYWDQVGWLVPVKRHKLERPVHPKSHIDELRPTLPAKYAPLSAKTGDGLQSVYLAAIPDDMAAVLVEKLAAADQELIGNAANLVSGGEELAEALEAKIQARIEQDTSIDTTEREALVKARKGHGRYRQNLELIENACRVSGVTDKRLLRASHIKPWRLCANNHERLDGNNGLLLSPNIDLLFDQGFLSFGDDGKLLRSTQVAAISLRPWVCPWAGNFAPRHSTTNRRAIWTSIAETYSLLKRLAWVSPSGWDSQPRRLSRFCLFVISNILPDLGFIQPAIYHI